MKENTLLDHWTGSVDFFRATNTRHNAWKRKRRIGLGIAFGALFIMTLLAAITNRRDFIFVAVILAVFCVLGTIGAQVNEPDTEHLEKYYAARDRLAKALGIDPEELEKMDYNRLRNSIVLPTLLGLFAKLDAQAANAFETDALATYNELDELHSACPPFRLLDGTDGKYTLEPFEVYRCLVVSA